MDRWTAAMRAERYDEAWAIAEHAMRARDPTKRDDPALPYHLRWVWDGRPFADREVLVRCYHGLGDTIQFARYLPELARRCASLSVEVHPRLIPLLAGIPGPARLIPFDPAHPAPPSPCDLEITELPLALRVAPSFLAGPYLQVPGAPLPAGTVGVCYQAGEWDEERSVPAHLFEPVCRQRNSITLVSEPSTLPVLNPVGCPFDIGETAALIASCALVITVDTMIAHLAGAMGRPTWLLLKHEPDWRWNPHALRSPWYPTMRLFHQPAAGDWSAVLAQVMAALDLEASSAKAAER